MSTNFYFQAGDSIGMTSEQRLMESLILESIKIYGHDVYYLPRTSVAQDNFFGEDVLSRFQQAYPIEMYLSNVQGWEGDGELMTKFGIRVTDQATFVVSKRRWEESVALQSSDLQLPKRPAEGDLLFFPKTKSMFEIKFVNHLNPFFQLSKFYIYSLQVELFQYSSERIETGVSDIDTRAAQFSRDILDEALVDGNDDPILDDNGNPIIEDDTAPSANTVNDTPQIRTESETLLDVSEINPFGEV